MSVPVDEYLARLKQEGLEQAKRNRGQDRDNGGNKDNGDGQGQNKDNGDEQDQNSDVITIKFKDSARYQRETPWKVKRTELLWTHLQNFAHSIQANFDSLRFITYEGQRINKDQTPESLDMEDGDVVDVMQIQYGGKLWLMEA